jgi:predicted nucleic-acid-binding protein
VIGVDANVLLRWMVDDDPGQAERASALLNSGEVIWVGEVVLAEIAWVLSTSYRKTRAQVAETLQLMLALPLVRIDRETVVRSALAAYAAGGGGFADHLIGAGNAASGCRTTFTFDRAAAKGPTFTSL